ncbi:Glu/Leu/Phe/Val dehydrogenase [Mumia zhuanghuii]|uniref:Glu/Leu/Phe/Val dehydrogenase n=1 Tax=Mumia zhuanghuii TaxID=2585211 RepID=A0A5Q6RK84_9ACTN|nr:Glu/Leu/Phe/Val dehydrogenase [Mumia zhuanghuii]
MSIEDVITGWDGSLVATRYDRETGAFFVVAIHSRERGPAAGGTRVKQYDSYADAVTDATRLAGAMTLKMAAADLPMGGGKAVIALPAPRRELADDHWRRILELHAENLKTLGGSYWTGPDLGTSSADMDVVCGFGAPAFGRSEAAGGSGSSAPATALGVHVAIVASAAEVGIDDLAGCRIAVQGLGAVGMEVVELARKDGAHLIVTDIDPVLCERAAALGAEVVPPDAILGVESDVFSPCAVGGVIDVDVARTIRTRAVVGSANNVLTDTAAGDELARRGIVLAPDFVASGGGAIHLIGREVLGWTAEEVATHVEGIADTLREVFVRSRVGGISHDHAARDLADERLGRAGSRV